MVFNTLQYLCFFPVVLILYFGMPKVFKKPWLLCVSYYFYMCWEPAYALLILFSTITTYLCSYIIDISKTPKYRKVSLILNILVNLSILFFFKYFNFFSITAHSVLAGMGIDVSLITIDTANTFILPVGISFYTFQSLGYSIDVYRNTIPHEKSFINYALFVSFFPQLVAGPIERASNFLPQLKTPTYFDKTRVSQGFKLMLWGFFQKVVVAEGAERILADVFAHPEKYNGHELILGTVLFAFRIYGDFAGYSNIAIGSANVLGFNLMRNFNHPYFATSISDFWSRWHISLSSWFQDYIFLPVVWNSKNKKIATYFAVLLVFLVSGFWHGAAWTFVVWGLIHAMFRITAMLTKKPRKKLYKLCRINIKLPIFTIFKILFTFSLVCFTFIFFRAENIEEALLIVKTIFTTPISRYFSSEIWLDALVNIKFFPSSLETLSLNSFYVNSGLSLTVCIIFMLVLEMFETKGRTIDKVVQTKIFPVRWLFCIVLLTAILLFGVYDASSFMYFQF